MIAMLVVAQLGSDMCFKVNLYIGIIELKQAYFGVRLLFNFDKIEPNTEAISLPLMINKIKRNSITIPTSHNTFPLEATSFKYLCAKATAISAITNT